MCGWKRRRPKGKGEGRDGEGTAKGTDSLTSITASSSHIPPRVHCPRRDPLLSLLLQRWRTKDMDVPCCRRGWRPIHRSFPPDAGSKACPATTRFRGPVGRRDGRGQARRAAGTASHDAGQRCAHGSCESSGGDCCVCVGCGHCGGCGGCGRSVCLCALLPKLWHPPRRG